MVLNVNLENGEKRYAIITVYARCPCVLSVGLSNLLSYLMIWHNWRLITRVIDLFVLKKRTVVGKMFILIDSSVFQARSARINDFESCE